MQLRPTVTHGKPPDRVLLNCKAWYGLLLLTRHLSHSEFKTLGIHHRLGFVDKLTMVPGLSCKDETFTRGSLGLKKSEATDLPAFTLGLWLSRDI